MQELSYIHQILTLQVSPSYLNDEIFLEHFYFLSTFKGLLLKRNTKSIKQFLECYTDTIEEYLLPISYLLAYEKDFIFYFPSVQKKLTLLLKNLKKEAIEKKNTKAEQLFTTTFQDWKKPQLMHLEKFEERELELRALDFEKEFRPLGLHDSFIMDMPVADILLHKASISILSPILEEDLALIYALGSIIRILKQFIGAAHAKPEEKSQGIEDVCYGLQDFLYIREVIRDFYPFIKTPETQKLALYIEQLIHLYQEIEKEEIEIAPEEAKAKILTFPKGGKKNGL